MEELSKSCNFSLRLPLFYSILCMSFSRYTRSLSVDLPIAYSTAGLMENC